MKVDTGTGVYQEHDCRSTVYTWGTRKANVDICKEVDKWPLPYSGQFGTCPAVDTRVQ